MRIHTLHIEFRRIDIDTDRVLLDAFAPPSGPTHTPMAGQFYLHDYEDHVASRPEAIRALAQGLVLHELDELIVDAHGEQMFPPGHCGSVGDANLSPRLTRSWEETIREDERQRILRGELGGS